MEVYVTPFPDVDRGRWQISTGGGESPLWAREGGELFYRVRGAPPRMMVVFTFFTACMSGNLPRLDAGFPRCFPIEVFGFAVGLGGLIA